MPTLTIYNMDRAAFELLQQRAIRHGQLLEEEARLILMQALQSDDLCDKQGDPWGQVDTLRQRIASTKNQQTDSVLLLQEDRAR